jgi:hypothetical protein
MDLITKRLLKIFPCIDESAIQVKHFTFTSQTFAIFDYKSLSYYLEIEDNLKDLLSYCPPIEDESESSVQQRVSDLTIRAVVHYENSFIVNKTIYVPSHVKVCSIIRCQSYRKSHEKDVFAFEAEAPIEALISNQSGSYICNMPVIEFYTDPVSICAIKQDLTQLDLQTYVDEENSKSEVQLPPNTKVRYVGSVYTSVHDIEIQYRDYTHKSDVYSAMELGKAKKAKSKQIVKAGNSSLSSVIIDLLSSQGIQATFNDNLTKLNISDGTNDKLLEVKSSKLRDLYVALMNEKNLTLETVVACCKNVFGETIIPSSDEILDYLQNTLIDRDFEAYVFKTNKKGTSCTLILIKDENATLFTLKSISAKRFEEIQNVVETAKSVDALYEGFENAKLLNATTYIPDVIYTYDLKDLDMLEDKVLNFKSDYVGQDGTARSGFGGLDAESCNKTGPRIKIKGINKSENTILNGGSLSRFELMQKVESLPASFLKSLNNTMLIINDIKTWSNAFKSKLLKMGVF